MRPLIVVNLDERIEAFLLLQIVEGCWLGGLVLQGEMHAFMAPVLLRVARLIRSIRIPSFSHQTDNGLKPKKALGEAKGTPLSVRIASGSPNSLKTRSNAEKAN